MDLLEACESLASNVNTFDVQDPDNFQVSDTDLQRWQKVFSFTCDEARNEIGLWRADFGRKAISQAAWEAVKDAKVKEGFDKEAYEYSISRQQHAPQKPSSVQPQGGGGTFLVKIQGHLSSPEVVQQLLNKNEAPTVLPAADDGGYTVGFCLLTGAEKSRLISALKALGIHYKPTFVRVSIASKDLSPESRYPTLGIDTTLPQYRPNSVGMGISGALPKQSEFPVWYFFYGTLADPSVLSRVTGAEMAKITYKRAHIHGAKLSRWGNKYLGLIDSGSSSMVDGWAYCVVTSDEEEALRVYETERYMVVRCRISMNEGGTETVVAGLTFRLI
jgi:hypothetical protein